MRRSSVWDYLAAILSLTTPALFYLTHHDYNFFAPEVEIFLMIFVAGGLAFGFAVNKGALPVRTAVLALLLTLFIDVQFNEVIQFKGIFWGLVILSGVFTGFAVLAWILRQHLARVLVAVFAAMIVTIIIFPLEKALPEAFVSSKKKATDKDLPLVIHLIFDAHIGIEGIPLGIPGGENTKRRVKDFYLDNGFKLFGKAYSQTGSTEVFLASMFNFLDEPTRNLILPGEGIFKYQVKENLAFDRLEEKGFEINVYQTSWTNFCSVERSAVVACRTFLCCSLKNIEGLEIPIADKFRVIASIFLEPLLTYRSVRKIYRKIVHLGAPFPVWEWERRFVNTFAGIAALTQLKIDLSSAGPGQYYFVHVLLPHSPYVFDSECGIMRAFDWLNRFSQKGLDVDRFGKNVPLFLPVNSATKNTPATRRLRYQRYFDQMECLYQKLGEIFDELRQRKLFDDAVIIVNGDHGSRLPITDPHARQKADVTKADKVDMYSTLFAVKSPGVSPSYDLRLLPVVRLFKSVMGANFGSYYNDETLNATAPVRVFPQGQGFERRMPDFGEGSDFQP